MKFFELVRSFWMVTAILLVSMNIHKAQNGNKKASKRLLIGGALLIIGFCVIAISKSGITRVVYFISAIFVSFFEIMAIVTFFQERKSRGNKDHNNY